MEGPGPQGGPGTGPGSGPMSLYMALGHIWALYMWVFWFMIPLVWPYCSFVWTLVLRCMASDLGAGAAAQAKVLKSDVHLMT